MNYCRLDILANKIYGKNQRFKATRVERSRIGKVVL